MRMNFRTLRWLTFAAFLFGVGWLIYQVLPPRPRWTLETDQGLQGFVPDGGGVVLVGAVADKRRSQTATVRDMADGAVRLDLPESQKFYFTPDSARVLWWDENQDLRGLDLLTGTMWSLDALRKASGNGVEFSPDGQLACVWRSVLDLCLIDTRKGKVLDESKWVGVVQPKVIFTSKYVIMAIPNSDWRIWDRTKEVAKNLPVRARFVDAAADGRSVSIRDDDSEGTVLVDFPDFTRPLPLGNGKCVYSPDGKYLAVARDTLAPHGTQTGARQIDLWDVSARRQSATLPNLDFHYRHFQQFSLSQIIGPFSEDGRRLYGFNGMAFVVHDASTGHELWRSEGLIGPEEVIDSGSFLALVIKENRVFALLPDRVEIREAVSGRLRHSFPRQAFLPHLLFPTCLRSPSGRYIVAAVPTEDNDRVKKFLKSWLPDSWFQPNSDLTPVKVSVIDMQTADVLADEIIYAEGPLFLDTITDDGRSLVVPSTRGYECWDIPFARPWGWIIGIPASIGVSVLAWKWLRRRKRRLQTEQAAPAPASNV